MPLSPQQRAVIEKQLEEASAALHRLEIGDREASLSYDGEQVTYSAADRGSLRSYIRQLEAKLGQRRFARARSRGVVF